MTAKKPELVVTAKDLDELTQLIDAGADAVTVGTEKYGLRITGDFSLDMIKEGVEIAHSKNAKVYVLINALLHNDALVDLDEYIKKLSEYNVDAIVFGDPAVLVIAKTVAPEISLQWNTETTATNFTTVNYWATKGIERAILARELSLTEVIDIKNNVNIDVQVQVHGMTCIFHSKRSLLNDYLDHIDDDTERDLSKEGKLFLREHKRPDENYPVFEDIHGTHIMSSSDICMIDHLKKFIEAGIDSLKIEGIYQTTEYLVEVVKLYREAIDNYDDEKLVQLLGRIKAIQPKNRPLETGFYFKEQYY